MLESSRAVSGDTFNYENTLIKLIAFVMNAGDFFSGVWFWPRLYEPFWQRVLFPLPEGMDN